MNFINTLSRFIYLNTSKFLITILLVVILSVLEGTMVYLVKPIISYFQNNSIEIESLSFINEQNLFIIFCLVVFAKFLFGLILYPVMINFLIDNQNKIRQICKEKIFKNENLRKKLSNLNFSGISSLIINETTKVTSSIQSITQSFQGLLPIVIIFIIFFKIDSKLTLIFLIISIIYLIIYYFLNKKRVYKYSVKKFFAEQLTNSQLITLFNNFVYFKINKKIYEKYIKIINKNLDIKKNISTKFAVVEIFPSLSIELFIYIGIGVLFFLSMNNLIQFSNYPLENIAMIIFGYLRLNKFFSLFLNNFLNFKSNEKSIITIADIIFQKENSRNELKNPKKIINGKIKDIKIKNLKLKYKNKMMTYRNYIFNKKNINLITGESGSGKTTLIEFILGIKDVKKDRGQILINDINFSSIDKFELWENISYLPSKPYVPEGKIMNTIKIINPNIDRKKILRLIKYCELTSIINNKNLNTFYIRENQKNISTGQIFRISLLLELIRKTELIIIDESLSQLDKINKIKIFNKLKKLSEEKILIIITHDKELIDSIKKNFNLNIDN